jgi:hypothetical protein
MLGFVVLVVAVVVYPEATGLLLWITVSLLMVASGEAGAGLISLKVLVKIMFDIYLIYDKFSSNQQKGEKYMGLDMYAHTRNQKVDFW